MAKWNGNKCGYCGHEEANLERYECPVCKRTGCPACMLLNGEVTGNDKPCNQCVEVAEQQAKGTNLVSDF